MSAERDALRRCESLRDTVPVELRERDQWVVWKRERRGDKWTKVPYRVDARTKAEVDDPRTWARFEQALAADPAAIHGYGYVFSVDDPFAGVDLDKCVDARTGELHPAAVEILDQLGGYQERSPSGTGMHAIVAARLGGDRHRTGKTPWGGEFEAYDRGRFFTVTGNGGGAITERQAQLDALVLRMFGPPTRNGAGPDDAGSGRSVEELIAQFPKLGEIAAHQGTAPKDDSDSGWDFYLACESARCGLTMGEFAALLRHSRKNDAKSLRGDYVKRTWEKAEEKVTAEEADPAKRISRRYNLSDPVIRGETLGDIASGAAKVYLHCQSGRRLRFPRLGDLFDPAKHTRIASQVTRSRFRALSGKEAADIAQSIIELCGGEDADPLDEARGWVIEFIAHAGATVDAVKADGSRKTRWEALAEIVDTERTLGLNRDIARRSVVIYDRGKDELWLPAGALKDYSSSRKSWPDFTSDLAEIGWRHKELFARPPGGRAERAEGATAKPIHRNFYMGRE